MFRTFRFRMQPTTDQRDTLVEHRDIYRQAYNHFLYRLNQHDGVPEMTTLRDELPDLKKWWNDLSDVYSRALQKVVERLYDNLESLKELKANGYSVGSLNWKPPREYRSFTYTQSGFKLDKKSGQTVLHLSKIGDIPLVITERFLTMRHSKRFTSSRNRPANGLRPSSSTTTNGRRRNPTIQNGASVSTWGYSNTHTTPTAMPSGR